MTKEKKLTEIENENTFRIGDYEFIKFSEENGIVTAVSRDSLFDSIFGRNNDLRESCIIDRLQTEVLPKIESIVGAENVLEFETDLLSLDGSSQYGVMKSKVSLPTFDFYRKHRATFEKHKIDKWWWLATPDSTPEWNTDRFIICVSPSGNFDYFDCSYGRNGVRPFWNFASSIFVSCEE